MTTTATTRRRRDRAGADCPGGRSRASRLIISLIQGLVCAPAGFLPPARASRRGMNWKRSGAAALSVSAAVGLVACGGGGTVDTTMAPPAARALSEEAAVGE